MRPGAAIPRGRALARGALQHESRAIAAQFTVAAVAMSIALQAGDADLLRLAADSIPSELRQIPGAEWWVQLLDNGAQLREPERVPSTIEPPPVLMLFLLASDLVLRLLLTDGRLDLDIRPFVAEALELVALHLSGGGHHEQAARLLGAAETARAEAGSTWRYPYQEQAVRNARQRITDALGESGLEEAADEGPEPPTPTPSTSPAACAVAVDASPTAGTPSHRPS